jgi:plasmid maintenance system killer protein
VIRSFGDSRTHQLWLTGKSKKFPPGLIPAALRKLLLIHVAVRLNVFGSRGETETLLKWKLSIITNLDRR